MIRFGLGSAFAARTWKPCGTSSRASVKIEFDCFSDCFFVDFAHICVMLNINVFYCFFYILSCNYLTFLFVVPRNWSSTICTELERCCRLRGSGTRGRDWHDRSSGVFGRGRGFPKPCGIWRKDYGHGAALHVFFFFLHFDAWCSAATLRKFNSTWLYLREFWTLKGLCQVWTLVWRAIGRSLRWLLVPASAAESNDV